MILLTPIRSILDIIRQQRMILRHETILYGVGCLRKSELDLMESVDCNGLRSLESGIWCFESSGAENSICWWFAKLSAPGSVPYNVMPNCSTRILSLSPIYAYSNHFLRVFHVRFPNSDNIFEKYGKFSTKAMVLVFLSWKTTENDTSTRGTLFDIFWHFLTQNYH